MYKIRPESRAGPAARSAGLATEGGSDAGHDAGRQPRRRARRAPGEGRGERDSSLASRNARTSHTLARNVALIQLHLLEIMHDIEYSYTC